jgi:hypothetical protein
MNSLDKIITEILADNYDEEFDPYDDEYLLEDYPCRLFYHEKYNEEFLNKLDKTNLVFTTDTIEQMLKYYEDNFDNEIIEAVEKNDLILLATLYAGYASKRLYTELIELNEEEETKLKKILENFNLEDYKVSTL